MGQKLCWCVLLQNVAGTFDPVQFGVRDPVGNSHYAVGFLGAEE